MTENEGGAPERLKAQEASTRRAGVGGVMISHCELYFARRQWVKNAYMN